MRPSPEAAVAGVFDRTVGRERLLTVLSLVAFVAGVVAAGVRHEPWFDEAQAWLIARDSGFLELFTRGVRFEGTPALWHLLLWVVQRLGLPYDGMWLVSGTLATIGAGVVLTKAPFPFALRAGVIFSYFFAYQYAVVARSYALDLVLVPLLASTYPSRLERPLLYFALLGLAANTNAHSFVLAAVLAFEATLKARRHLLRFRLRPTLAVILFAVAALAAAVQAYPPHNINFMIRKPGDIPVLHALQLASEAFVDRWDILSTSPPSPLARLIGGLISLALLGAPFVLFARARTAVLALGLLGGLVGFSALKYGNAWHAGIMFLAFLFVLWVSWGEVPRLGKRTRAALGAALCVLFAVQIWNAAAAAARDIIQTYSPAADMAALLAAPGGGAPRGGVGVVGFKGFAVQPYFRVNIFSNYEGGRPRPAYYLWRKDEHPIPGVSEAEWMAVATKGYGALLLSGFNLMGVNGPYRYVQDARAAGYCPVASRGGALIWKTYVLETDDMMLFHRCPPSELTP